MRRAVPKAFAEVESRKVVWVQLDANNKNAAEREAERVWKGLLYEWERKRVQGDTGYQSKLAIARALAKKHGVRFLPAEEVRKLPQAEISDRTMRAFSVIGDVGDDFEAAFLGVLSEPSHKLSYMFEAFRDEFKYLTANMSELQKRRLLSDSCNAMTLMIDSISDMPVSWIDAEDLCKLVLDLKHRVPSEWSSYNTVRVKLLRMHRVLSIGAQRLRIKLPFNLKDYLPQKQDDKWRPAFTRDWLQQKLLAPDALVGLALEDRCLMLGMVNTGYRPSEGVNLTRSAIRLDCSVPHILIEPDGRKLKTRNAHRHIPLIGVSLEAMRHCPNGFPSLRNDAGVSSRLNRYLMRQGLQETPEHSLYSLRHGLEARMIEADIEERLRATLMGHAIKRATYSHFLPLPLLQKALVLAAL